MTEAPRWMDRYATADYLCVRVDELPRLEKKGKLPKPSMHLGPRSPRWDRLALDALFSDGGTVEPDYDQQAQEIINAAYERRLAKAKGRAEKAGGRHNQGIPLRGETSGRSSV